VESTQRHEEIRRAKRPPSREFFVDAERVKEIGAMTELTQAMFARLLDVDVGTPHNWEQGRRQPTGSARALLRSRGIRKAMLKALAA
jgi:putative transcriptional regulator